MWQQHKLYSHDLIRKVRESTKLFYTINTPPVRRRFLAAAGGAGRSTAACLAMLVRKQAPPQPVRGLGALQWPTTCNESAEARQIK